MASRFLQAIISTSPVSACWAIAGTSPSRSNRTASSRSENAVSDMGISGMGALLPGSRPAQAVEALLQVADQVGGILQPGMQAQQRAGLDPIHGGPDRPDV